VNSCNSIDLFKSSTFKISDFFVFKNACENIRVAVTISINIKLVLKSKNCLNIIDIDINNNSPTKRNEY